MSIINRLVFFRGWNSREIFIYLEVERFLFNKIKKRTPFLEKDYVLWLMIKVKRVL